MSLRRILKKRIDYIRQHYWISDRIVKNPERQSRISAWARGEGLERKKEEEFKKVEAQVVKWGDKRFYDLSKMRDENSIKRLAEIKEMELLDAARQQRELYRLLSQKEQGKKVKEQEIFRKELSLEERKKIIQSLNDEMAERFSKVHKTVDFQAPGYEIEKTRKNLESEKPFIGGKPKGFDEAYYKAEQHEQERFEKGKKVVEEAVKKLTSPKEEDLELEKAKLAEAVKYRKSSERIAGLEVANLRERRRQAEEAPFREMVSGAIHRAQIAGDVAERVRSERRILEERNLEGFRKARRGLRKDLDARRITRQQYDDGLRQLRRAFFR